MSDFLLPPGHFLKNVLHEEYTGMTMQHGPLGLQFGLENGSPKRPDHCIRCTIHIKRMEDRWRLATFITLSSQGDYTTGL